MVAIFKKENSVSRRCPEAAAKFIPSLRQFNYGQRLQKLELTTLETRRRRNDLIKKIITGKDKLSSKQFSSLLHRIPDQRPQLVKL